jgi:putative hydrolase of the HAD superfamily
MKKKAIIFDLDNTVYAVHSIGKELFASLFELIFKNGNHTENIDKIKDEIMRRPFQVVAKDYHFSEELTQKGIALLKELAYRGKIEPYPDYQFAKDLPLDKFLVTTGFLKLQQSKVAGMKIGQDFKEIVIVDPSTSARTKKDVFAEIMKRHGYNKSELLVVGDDLHSEIRAAQELRIDAVLYDRHNFYCNASGVNSIQSFKELVKFI